jgi:choline dehydrogenase-like flavoprotein
MATGRLTLIPNAMAREVLVGKDGKAEAVSYVEKTTREERQVRARAFVIGASACESARLLLNSKSSRFPNGLANSSGVVGRYLTDTVGSYGVGHFPQLERVPPHNHDGVGGMHLYVPWWKFDRTNDFLRYHIEFGGGRVMPHFGQFNGVCQQFEGYGLGLKQKCRENYGTLIGFSGRGEMIPNEDTYCELDPNVTDAWGIPVLRFHFKWGSNEIKMRKTCRKLSGALSRKQGART